MFIINQLEMTLFVCMVMCMYDVTGISLTLSALACVFFVACLPLMLTGRPIGLALWALCTGCQIILQQNISMFYIYSYAHRNRVLVILWLIIVDTTNAIPNCFQLTQKHHVREGFNVDWWFTLYLCLHFACGWCKFTAKISDILRRHSIQYCCYLSIWICDMFCNSFIVSM